MYEQAKQSALIRFACVNAGSTVIDVYPGDGDWTRLFSDVVGPEGQVYSFVPAEVADFKNDPVGRMQTSRRSPGERTSKPSQRTSSRCRRPRKQRMSCGCTCSTMISTPRDPEEGATVAAFNRAVYERLKPGGCYVVVDHAAAAGSGTRDTQALHRIDPASVREEVEEAGFVLDAESDMLANKDDPHSIKVFDPSIKGQTDRFAYRFVKR